MQIIDNQYFMNSIPINTAISDLGFDGPQIRQMRLIYTDFFYDFLEKKISVNQSYQPNQCSHDAKAEITVLF